MDMRGRDKRAIENAIEDIKDASDDVCGGNQRAKQKLSASEERLNRVLERELEERPADADVDPTGVTRTNEPTPG